MTTKIDYESEYKNLLRALNDFQKTSERLMKQASVDLLTNSDRQYAYDVHLAQSRACELIKFFAGIPTTHENFNNQIK